MSKQRDPDAGPFDGVVPSPGSAGSGKTTRRRADRRARAERARRVGITAHSHAVIANLIETVGERGAEVSVLQKAEDHQRCCGTESSPARRQRQCGGRRRVPRVRRCVIARTSWLCGEARMKNGRRVDVLFVDEAGRSHSPQC